MPSTSRSVPVVLLPTSLLPDPHPPALSRWWRHGRLLRRDQVVLSLARVLQCLDRPLPGDGLAALRFAGEGGDPGDSWLAAADPVYLEARLDYLFLHRVWLEEGAADAMARCFASLQSAVGDGVDWRLHWNGRHGYLRGATGFVVADAAPEAVDGARPDDCLPPPATGADFHALSSEMQMHLHDTQEEREAAGLPPMNALWLWGGGKQPELSGGELPPLYADDALCRGYWKTAGAVVHDWPGSIAACAAAGSRDFVAIVPEAPAGTLAGWIDECRALPRVTTLLTDGRVVERRRGDHWRIWRRSLPAVAAPQS